MTNLGFVKIHRKILDNPIVCKDSDYFAVWNYLLLKATHTSYAEFFKGERIELKSGQLITGRKKIADKFKINESKVQRILKDFENEQQIEQITSNQNRLISILNWGEYQLKNNDAEQRVNNERTTSEQRVNTNKNVKNIYSIFLKKYREECAKDFRSKMKFLRDIKITKEYKELNPDEENELRELILKER